MIIAAVMTALHLHLSIMPLFYPDVEGIHNGTLNINNAPSWNHIFHSQNLQQPDGVILTWNIKWQ